MARTGPEPLSTSRGSGALPQKPRSISNSLPAQDCAASYGMPDALPQDVLFEASQPLTDLLDLRLVPQLAEQVSTPALDTTHRRQGAGVTIS